MALRAVQRLTEEEGGALNPNWSPDGSAIAWTHETAGNSDNYDVWVVNSDGSEKRQVTSKPATETDPA
jgi:TolB protein